MPELEFEVGDRVRCKNEALLYEITSIISDSDCFSIIDPNSGKKYPYRIEPVDGDNFFYACENDLELISKRSESDMQDVDAIAVEVDDEYMAKGIIEKAREEFGYEKVFSWTKPSSYLWFGEQKVTDRDSVVTTGCLQDRESLVGNLSENWNKVVEFLEQESEETFELAGKEVELIEKGRNTWSDFKIGCYEKSCKHLHDLVEALDKLEITGGTLKYSSYDVDVEEVKELYEYLKEQGNQ